MNKDRSSLWLSLIVIFLVCGVTFLSVKESKKDETWKEEQDRKEAKVYEAMDSYTEELSRILRNDGLEDIEVVWTECTSEEYTEKYGFVPSYCTYFFSVDYYCDEIEKNSVLQKNKHNTDNYKGTYYNPYGVENYDNPDSFAEEMAEEFGDGDFEDGYDDAYDYWEEEYE